MNPQPFGRYELVKRLAVGGTGEVWRARQPLRTGGVRELVIKRLLPHLGDEPETVQAFKREALLAGQFDHPNIARIHEFGLVDEQHYIAREFIPGGTVGMALRKGRPEAHGLTPALALRVMATACEGLHYAHTRTDSMGRPLKVMHLDAHLHTLLIGLDGAVKWIGFGPSLSTQGLDRRLGILMISAIRLAPEQLTGRALDHRVDIFALGRMLYELLTGVRPFKRDSEPDTIKAIIDGELRPPSEVAHTPVGLDPIVMKALAREPDDRYSSARELQLELEQFLAAQRWEATPEQLGQMMKALV